MHNIEHALYPLESVKKKKTNRGTTTTKEKKSIEQRTNSRRNHFSTMNWQYKHEHSLEQRRFESERIRRRYPDRVPVIVQPLLNSASSSSSSILSASLFRSFSSSASSASISSHETILPRLDNEKFLVPAELSFGQFAYNIRRRLRLRAEHALFFYLGGYGKQPVLSATMEQLYNENKDQDGFLYVCYADEKVFG